MATTATTASTTSSTGAVQAAAPVLRFYYNGIKGPDGRLQLCWYSWSRAWDHGARHEPAHVSIYRRSVAGSFSADVRAVFDVRNNSDGMADYYESDGIMVPIAHPLFPAVARALIQRLERDVARCERRGKGADAAGYRRDLADLQVSLVRHHADAAAAAVGGGAC